MRYAFDWIRWGVGWIPFVGWLSPQVTIFYNFGERIVRSLVFNSADWLWGPLPFFEGLGNIAEDSWDALVQLGIDQWNFWGLPPLPFAARQAELPSAAAQTLDPADKQVTPPTVKPKPLRDLLAALRQLFVAPDRIAPQKADLKLKVDAQAKVDVQGVPVPAIRGDELQVQESLADTDTALKTVETKPIETKTNPPAGAPRGTHKVFGQKPKPAAETSDLTTEPSKKFVGTSNPAAGTSSDAVGTSKPAKDRFNGPRKHRLTGAPSASKVGSAAAGAQ